MLEPNLNATAAYEYAAANIENANGGDNENQKPLDLLALEKLHQREGK